DLFFYFTYKTAGLAGLFSFRYFCVSLLVIECYLLARKSGILTKPATWLICLLAVLMSYSAIVAKSEIFSFLFICLFAFNWWYIRTEGDTGWGKCYFFPIIMLLWVNSHGGFVFGIVFLICIGTGELLNGLTGNENKLSAKTRKHLFIALILSVLSLFLTPYGYKYLYQLFYFFLPTKENLTTISNIAAYGSPFRPEDKDAIGFVVQVNISIAILFLLYIRNFRKVEWSSLLANLVFVFLYTRFYRTTFYWAPVFLFSSLSLLTLRPLAILERKRWITTLLVPIITVGISAWIAGSALYKATFFPERDCWVGYGIGDMNPVAEAEYIKKNYPTARIGNTYDEGAYLLWKLWPDNKIFIDARHFPFREWDSEYWKIFSSDLVYKKPAIASDFLQRYPCDLWCVGRSNIAMSYWFLFSPDWQLAFYGKSASIFVRKGIPLPKKSQRFSADLNTLKNFGTAFDVLNWVVTIQDWQAVDLVLERMRKYFIHPEHQKLIHQYEIALQSAKKNTL
ncbi:MAG: hypothetical protein D3922_07110, partial [Candidatus Electrothrix sp. AR1]|nr:hypothetical protein [Candidatus Electrothrix sp. AR1]